MKKIILLLMCLVGLSSVSSAMSIEDAIKMLTRGNQRAVQYVSPIMPEMVMVKAQETSVSFQDMFNMSGCYVTRDSHGHIIKGNGSMYATDLDCDKANVSFDVKAPNYSEEYVVTSKGYDQYLGNYLVISWSGYNIIYGHLNSSLNVGDKLLKGAVVGNTNLSGKTTAHHVHIELWRKESNGELVNLRFDFETINPYSQKLLDQRKQYKVSSTKYYFTHYDLGDVNQNDGAPCNGASGKDLCELQRKGVKTMALTKDIRLKLGVKFGDKVKLTGDKGCAGVYEVHDEMNCRFRGANAHDNGTCYNRNGTIANGNVKRPGTNYYIKGDVQGAGGACSVKKL